MFPDGLMLGIGAATVTVAVLLVMFWKIRRHDRAERKQTIIRRLGLKG